MAGPSARMLDLLSLLQTHREWSGHDLASRLRVHVRTIRRDVDRLRELGYRVEALKGPDGGYRLSAGSELPPLLFDEEQAVALAIALYNVPGAGVDVVDAAQRALATVRQVMPAHLRQRIDAIAFDATPPREVVDPSVVYLVTELVKRHIALRFRYGDSTGHPRTIEPHGLVSRSGRWYLIGWEAAKQDWRVYRLDKVLPLVPNGPRFTPREIPGGSAAGLLAARVKGSQSEDRWPVVGVVQIEASATDVAKWIPDAVVTATSDASCTAAIGSWSWHGLLASVLRFGVPFRVVEPAELKHEAARVADLLRNSHE